MDEASGENLYLNNDNVAVELSLAMQNLFKCQVYFFQNRGKRKEAPFPLRLASLFSQERQGEGGKERLFNFVRAVS